VDRRQRLLIVVLGLALTGVLADQAYRRLYEQPLQNAQQRVARLQKELDEGQRNARRQQHRLPDLDELKNRSLPRNLELAVTEYRSWLLQTLEGSGLEQTSLDSGTPAPVRDIYTRVDFSLRTRGNLTQLTQFLHAFYSTNYLHKARSLTLTPTSDGTVDVSMTIETLSIPSLASSDQLLTASALEQPLASMDQYNIIARRNLFRPGDPPAASIKLSAITTDVDQRRQVWLSFLRTGETRMLGEGDAVTTEGSSLRVTQIQPDTADFEIDGQRCRVHLGHTLE
jgi:hypothetical protein